MEDGGVWVWGDNNRGGAAEGAKVGKGAKITLEHMKIVVTMMYEVRVGMVMEIIFLLVILCEKAQLIVVHYG